MGLKPMLIFVMEEGGHAGQLPSFPGYPVDPGYGVEAPVDPGFGVPGRPPRPSHGLPGAGGRPPRPDQGLPGSQPGIDNTLPPIPVVPEQGLPDPGTGQTKPSVPATLPALPQGAFLVAWAPGHGWVAVPVTPPHASGQPVPPGTAPTPTPQGRR